jgi:hypothetical protein
MAQMTYGETASGWKILYRAGGWAALLAAIVFRRNLSAELKLFGSSRLPAMPVDAVGWFALLRSNRLLGLTLLDIFDSVNYALVALLILALAAALRRENAAAGIIAAVCGVGAAAISLASSRALPMLAIAGRYEAASGADRAAALAAGEALLAAPRTGVHIALLLVALAGLILSLAMLRSGAFNRATAIVGIAAHGILLGVFPVLAFAPGLLALPNSLAAPFIVAWQIMAGLRLLRLAKTAG